MTDKIDRNKSEQSIVQNTSEDACGVRANVQGETHTYVRSPSPLDRSGVASQPDLVSTTFNDAQRQRLIAQQDSLQSAWNLASQKLDRLRQAYAIEAGIAVKFQLEREIEVAETEVKDLMERLNAIEHVLLATPERSPQVSPIVQQPKMEDFEYPEGVVPLESKFYMEPDSSQKQCQQAIIRPGALLRIQAPGRMGKTSLLNRIIAHAEGLNYRIARVDLGEADSEILHDLDLLLQWLCQQVCDSLGMTIDVADNWKNRGGSKSTCTKFFEKYILSSFQEPLLLCLDNLEFMFKEPSVSENFGSLLRSWHEKKNETWNRVRLVLVHIWYIESQNLNNSPFNVGQRIELPGLTSEQVGDLVTLHGLNWRDTEIDRLTNFVGNLPYLIRFAIYHIATGQTCLDEIVETGYLGDGLFQEHLRRHLSYLERQPAELREIMAQVVKSDNPPIIRDVNTVIQLRDTGLVRLDGDRVLPANRLYQLYFANRL